MPNTVTKQRVDSKIHTTGTVAIISTEVYTICVKASASISGTETQLSGRGCLVEKDKNSRQKPWFFHIKTIHGIWEESLIPYVMEG